MVNTKSKRKLSAAKESIQETPHEVLTERDERVATKQPSKLTSKAFFGKDAPQPEPKKALMPLNWAAGTSWKRGGAAPDVKKQQGKRGKKSTGGSEVASVNGDAAAVDGAHDREGERHQDAAIVGDVDKPSTADVVGKGKHKDKSTKAAKIVAKVADAHPRINDPAPAGDDQKASAEDVHGKAGKTGKTGKGKKRQVTGAKKGAGASTAKDANVSRAPLLWAERQRCELLGESLDEDNTVDDDADAIAALRSKRRAPSARQAAAAAKRKATVVPEPFQAPKKNGDVTKKSGRPKKAGATAKLHRNVVEDDDDEEEQDVSSSSDSEDEHIVDIDDEEQGHTSKDEEEEPAPPKRQKASKRKPTKQPAAPVPKPPKEAASKEVVVPKKVVAPKKVAPPKKEAATRKIEASPSSEGNKRPRGKDMVKKSEVEGRKRRGK